MEMSSSNPKVLSTIQLKLKELGAVSGRVGWFETAVYPTGRSVAEVAAGNEFGIANRSIPPRPFMGPAVAEHQKQWEVLAAQGANQVLAGKETAEKVMGKLVISAHNEVSKNIATLTSPPLSPITIAARKYKKQGKTITGSTIGEIAAKLKAGTLDISGVSTKPLEDTGLMSATLTSLVDNTTVKVGI